MIEEDLTAGHLNHYSALYVVDPQVSEAAMAAAGQWVRAGGQLLLLGSASSLSRPGHDRPERSVPLGSRAYTSAPAAGVRIDVSPGKGGD